MEQQQTQDTSREDDQRLRQLFELPESLLGHLAEGAWRGVRLSDAHGFAIRFELPGGRLV